MKINKIVLATSLMLSISTFAQKDELKTLKKIYAKSNPSPSDLADYKSNVAKLESVATEESDKVYSNFYKAMIPVLDIMALGKNPSPEQISRIATPKMILDLGTALNATLEFEKKSGKKIYTDDINETIKAYKPMFMQIAINYGNDKKYNEAAKIFYAIYQMDKKDADKLYYAASYAVSGDDFDTALDYYKELKLINYSGEGVQYLAVNKATGTEETFNNKEERTLFIKAGSHEKPRDEKIPSKRGEIYKNTALILVEKGKVEEAKAALKEARQTNPEDTGLMLTEAELYLKLNDNDTYKKIIEEIILLRPNDADLVYNLGIISLKSNAKNAFAEAEKQFKKVIEIDPKYVNAYLQLADIKLQSDQKIVDEMNKLGTSEKDNKRYEVLKKERGMLFTSALPYLEKAFELDSKNEAVIENLKSVYNFLEMTDKYKAMKALSSRK